MLFLFSLPSVFAGAPSQTEGIDWQAPVTYIKFAAYFIAALSAFITLVPFGRELSQTHKKFFFMLFVIPIVLPSLYLAGHTIHENIVSDTKGPIHWHADYEVWVCGDKLDLIDPKGLKNKIGTPLFHEHNDDRIHVEGTVRHIEDVSLGNYFRVIGGELTATSISYVTEDKGTISKQNGDTCADGSVGELAVYVNGEKLEDPANYVLAPEVFVPNGDCIIFDFSQSPPEQTNYICPSWEANGLTYEMFHLEKAGGENNG